MSIPSIQKQSGAHHEGSIPTEIKAIILNTLANVVDAYLNVIQKNCEKIAEQDRANHQAVEKESRKAAILSEAIADDEKTDSRSETVKGKTVGLVSAAVAPAPVADADVTVGAISTKA